MAFDINSFKTKINSGVRPNLFRIDFPGFPGKEKANDNDIFTFLCKSAALPSSTMGTIEVPFRGRNLKIPGDRTFDSWTVTFINDANFGIRSAFEEWMNRINKLDSNVGNLNPSQIFIDITVNQLAKVGAQAGTTTSDNASVIRTYNLYGAWPSSVSQITLGYDQNDQIEEFDVEFQYQYFSIGKEAAIDIS